MSPEAGLPKHSMEPEMPGWLNGLTIASFLIPAWLLTWGLERSRWVLVPMVLLLAFWAYVGRRYWRRPRDDTTGKRQGAPND